MVPAASSGGQGLPSTPQRLELQVLQCVNNGAQKRPRKKQKVEFDEVVVEAAEELAREREQRALDKDLERKRLALEEAKRGLVWRHPCVE